MKRLQTISILLLSFTLILSACGKKAETAERGNDKTELKQEHKEWYSFPEGMKLAENSDKHIIVDFYTDWCKWCKVMDEKTFSVPEVEAYLFEHFIPIRIDAESEEITEFKGQNYSYKQLTQAFGVTGFPSLAYLSPEKEIITIVPGYVEKEPFLNILEYVSKECYTKDVPFESFKEDGDCQ
ncbi:MAG: thioredoxin fold domain-containing protein [Candidatus Marinimicrobia bacterium]|nr:thioredoxin fold domain-containing protein [Candidatus Neomarinimicrobiota bacterium]